MPDGVEEHVNGGGRPPQTTPVPDGAPGAEGKGRTLIPSAPSSG